VLIPIRSGHGGPEIKAIEEVKWRGTISPLFILIGFIGAAQPEWYSK